MAEVYTNGGLEWLSGKKVDSADSTVLFGVAVGDGTSSPSSGDTSMESEIHRTNADNSNCTIETTSNNGEIRVKVSVSGGSEVPGGSDISEFGVFTDESTPTMVYHEVTSGKTVTDGTRVTFEMLLTVVDD